MLLGEVHPCAVLQEGVRDRQAALQRRHEQGPGARVLHKAMATWS